MVFCTESQAARKVQFQEFRHANYIGDDIFELEMKKKKIALDLPLQIAFFVYQYAKLRMLEFYYDFMLRFVDRADFEYCEMDTGMFMCTSTFVIVPFARLDTISIHS